MQEELFAVRRVNHE